MDKILTELWNERGDRILVEEVTDAVREFYPLDADPRGRKNEEVVEVPGCGKGKKK